jgi:hypothetical protein
MSARGIVMVDISAGVPGVNAPDPRTYEEFWPYYVSQHLHPMTRAMHVLGTTLAILAIVAAVVFLAPLLLVAVPVLGYGFAFASHFVWEKNKPASFGHPIWSFRADLRQLWKAYSGLLQADVRAVRAAAGVPPDARTLAEAA